MSTTIQAPTAVIDGLAERPPVIVEGHGLARCYGDGRRRGARPARCDALGRQGRARSRSWGLRAPASPRSCTSSPGLTARTRAKSGSPTRRSPHLGDDALTKLRRRHVGFIFQFFNLLPMLTAEENVLLPLRIAGTQARSRVGGRGRLDGRARGPALPPAVRALGRPAAAGRHRPRDGLPADGDVRRRADRQPRLADGSGDPRAASALGGELRADDRHGHPRSDRGGDRRPHRVPRRRSGRQDPRPLGRPHSARGHGGGELDDDRRRTQRAPGAEGPRLPDRLRRRSRRGDGQRHVRPHGHHLESIRPDLQRHVREHLGRHLRQGDRQGLVERQCDDPRLAPRAGSRDRRYRLRRPARSTTSARAPTTRSSSAQTASSEVAMHRRSASESTPPSRVSIR